MRLVCGLLLKLLLKNLCGIQIVFSTPIRNIIQKTVWNIYKFITEGQITMLAQALSVKTHFKYFNCHLQCANHGQKFELVYRKKIIQNEFIYGILYVIKFILWLKESCLSIKQIK